MDLDICCIVLDRLKNKAAWKFNIASRDEPLTVTLKMTRYLKTRIQHHRHPKQLLLELLQFLDVRERHSKVCQRSPRELPSNLELRKPCLFSLFEHELSKS